ncbi:MAG: ShlB/FhaC/HecB family hemolysin secretion/activation protein [Burkholderiales bacterium]
MNVVLRTVVLVACLGACPFAFGDVPLALRKPEWLGTPELMRAMQNGGYVVYFRHGLTNWSEKLREQRNTATKHFDLANCASQRNLSEAGRSEARMIRFALAQMKIPVGRVYASQYCRPAEHVAIIAGREPDERVFWLTGLGRPETLPRLRERVSTPPETGTNILLGDHGDLIYNITDWVIEEGDAVVFRPEPPGYKFVAWIRPHEWLDLARRLEATDRPAPPTIAAFEIEGDLPIGIDAARAVVAPFVGKPAGTDARYLAAVALEHALRERGFGSHTVTLTDSAAAPVVRLTVRKWVIGKVAVAGTGDYGAAHLRAAVPALREGDSLDSNALRRQLLAAGDHPFRTVEVLFRRGTAPDTLDADIAVSGRRPWSASASLDNAGTDATGRVRVGLSASHANVFDRAHVATIGAMTAPENTDDTRQWGAAYSAPVPALAGAITGYWSRSTISFGSIPGVTELTGPGHFGGVRYRHQLPPRGDYSAEIVARLDDKSYAGPTLATNVRARPLSIGYGGHWEGQWIGWNYGVEYARNIEGGSANDDATYAQARPNANAEWSALRANADLTRILTYDLRLIVRARAQVARSPLIAGEQMALGGALTAWGGWPWGGTATVRGFEERTVLGDSGFVSSVEFWSRRLLGHDFRAGGFWDWGHVTRENTPAGQLDAETITSIGAALRYRLDTRAQGRIDFARVMRGTADRPEGSHRVFLSVLLTY